MTHQDAELSLGARPTVQRFQRSDALVITYLIMNDCYMLVF